MKILVIALLCLLGNCLIRSERSSCMSEVERSMAYGSCDFLLLLGIEGRGTGRNAQMYDYFLTMCLISLAQEAECKNKSDTKRTIDFEM